MARCQVLNGEVSLMKRSLYKGNLTMVGLKLYVHMYIMQLYMLLLVSHSCQGANLVFPCTQNKCGIHVRAKPD